MYAIAGNHDIVNRNGAIPPQVLFKKFGLKLISPINTNYMHDDVFIAGLPFYPASQNKNLKSKLDELSKKQKITKNLFLFYIRELTNILIYSMNWKLVIFPIILIIMH